ncbi:hypothetical protein ACQ86N_25030 [Puia sp. P3]|uniref:hypothetical protein n=1 Tax=Puia sp. P3 TaxID=3423952 RepID=UPI003D6736F4
MKHTPIFTVVFLLLFCSCGTLEPTTSSGSLETSVNIEVECRNDAGTRAMVMNMLRRGRAKDVREDLVGYVMQIRASYYLADNSPQKAGGDRESVDDAGRGIPCGDRGESHGDQGPALDDRRSIGRRTGGWLTEPGAADRWVECLFGFGERWVHLVYENLKNSNGRPFSGRPADCV